MTSEEIKQNTSMFDVLNMYGLQTNRSGMCSCPWHRDRHPSMKIYADGYKCFTCGKAGDIFGFVQEMEGCSFKEAYIKLGGTYEHASDVQHILIRKKFEKDKQKRDKQEQFDKQIKDEVLYTLRLLEETIDKEEPFSDLWCWCQNKIAYIKSIWETKYVEGQEVNEIDVHRVCQQIKRGINPC